MKTRIFAFLICTSLYGCSSDAADNAPPVLDSVDGPAETTLKMLPQGQFYVVEYEGRFHDDDKDAVTSARYRVADLGIDQKATLQGANPDAPGATFIIGFPTNVPKKAYDIVITILDARGAESAPVTKNVTVK